MSTRKSKLSLHFARRELALQKAREFVQLCYHDEVLALCMSIARLELEKCSTAGK